MPTDRKVVPADVLEQRFAIALYRLHQFTNLLDLNLGLSIRFIENPGHVEDSHSWLSRSNLASKIRKFRCLVCDRKGSGDIDAWYFQAQKARCDRNILTHAYWEILPMDVETPVHMRVHPWMREDLETDVSEKMSIEQFETLVNSVQVVFEDFMNLRQKIGV